jgi:type VI secretion system secreted protein Hcp
MASDNFVLIDTINGESQAVNMTNYIELDSFSFGATNPPDIGGQGLSGGKCSLSEFSFSCGLDSASYQILKALYTGQHIATATYAGRKSGGGTEPFIYLKAIMTNVYISSQSVGGGAMGIPNQSVSLAYEQIEFQYYTQDTSTGAVTLAGSAIYNIGKAQQS